MASGGWFEWLDRRGCKARGEAIDEDAKQEERYVKGAKEGAKGFL